MSGRVTEDETRDIDAAITGLTMPRAFAATAARQTNDVALRWHEGTEPRTWTWSELSDQACRFASGLRELGIRPGDRVLTMMRNRPEFHAVDLAVQLIGAVPTAVFNSSSPEQLAHVAGHCGATAAVVGDPDLQDRFLSARADMPDLRHVITLDGDPGTSSYAELVGAAPLDLERAAGRTHPDSLVTLIYTSGTTGPPKAAMLSQRNACWMIEATRRAMGTTMEGWRVISYMPMAHIAERTLSYWHQLMDGSEVTVCPDPQTLAALLLEVRPHFFGAVPRVWEKMHAGITTAVAADPQRGAQFRDALAVGLDIGRARLAGKEICEDDRAWQEASAVLTPYKALVGLDACRMALTGSAPTPPHIFDFFLGLGFPIAEVYGFSEAGNTTGFSMTEVRPGTVGKPLPGVRVALAGDGELLVRSGSLCSGYLHDPHRTAEAFDADGWYHTGDVATIDEDGFVSIVDRKKEIIITATGENVSPANLQNALKSCELIGQACAVGDGRPYVTAVVTLSPEATSGWARAQGLESDDDIAVLARDPRVRAEVERQVAEANARLSRIEQIKKFAILATEWLPDSDELTPTMKVKRRVVLTKYADEIEGLYT